MKKSPLGILFLTVFLDLVGFGIVLPLLPSFARHPHSATEWQVGLLMATYSLAQFVFSPIWGRLSDRIGRRPVLILSITGSAASYLIFAFAPNLTVLFLSRFVAGAMAANVSTAMAYVADTTAPEDRARGMGMIGAAFGLGFVFGPAIGAWLSTLGEPQRAVGLFAAGMSLLDAVLATRFLRESLTPAVRAAAAAPVGSRLGRMAAALRSRRLAFPILVTFLGTIAWSQLEPTAALLAREQFAFSPARIGMLFAYLGVLVAVVQGGLAGRLARRLGEVKMVVVGLVMLVLGMVHLALVSGGISDGTAFHPRDFKNTLELTTVFALDQREGLRYIREHASPPLTAQLASGTGLSPTTLASECNRLLDDPNLARTEPLESLQLPADLLRRAAAGPLDGTDLRRVNRALILALFAGKLVPEDDGLWIGLALLAIGQALTTPALQSLVSRATSAESQGATLGVSQGFSSLARAVGPALGGTLFGVMHGLPFWVAAGILVAALLLAGRIASPSEPRPRVRPASD